MNIEDFSDKLIQAIAWIDNLTHNFDYEEGNYGTVLRYTNPIINGIKLYTIDSEYTTWNIDDYNVENFDSALKIATAVRKVTSVLKHNTLPIDLRSIGRVLCFSTLVTTHDGMAAVDSQGFVDESDVPPIDTWFYLESNFIDSNRPTLFCWIPIKFENVMEKAIKAEIMESYTWLDEIAPLFYQKIEKSFKIKFSNILLR